MKTILKSLLFICISYSSYAQLTNNTNFVPFIGHWEWQNGNETFKVDIYADGNDLKGHYKLVETDANGNETLIYKSNKVINQNTGFKFGYAIFGGSNDGTLFFALVEDNVLMGDGIHSKKNGSLGFTITNDGTNGQPITATWKVHILQGLKSTDTPEEFSIPTDIILTKVD